MTIEQSSIQRCGVPGERSAGEKGPLLGAIPTKQIGRVAKIPQVIFLFQCDRKDVQPPSFFHTDEEKWRRKFESPNKSLADAEKQYENRFHYNFGRAGSRRMRRTGFSNVDAVLLKGNAGEVRQKRFPLTVVRARDRKSESGGPQH